MVNSFLDNYGNCSTFKLCNENEDFGKYANTENERDYKSMMMLTPPSKAH